VARVHARELGKKVMFKDLIREGGEFAVDFFESITYQEPLRTFEGWGGKSRSFF